MTMHTMKSGVLLGERLDWVLVLAELSSGRCLKNLGNGGRFDGSRGIAAIGETGRQRH